MLWIKLVPSDGNKFFVSISKNLFCQNVSISGQMSSRTYMTSTLFNRSNSNHNSNYTGNKYHYSSSNHRNYYSNSRNNRNSYYFDDKIVPIIIATNIGVWGVWLLSTNDYYRLKFLKRHFLLRSKGVLNEGLYHTMITSMFSHIDFWHLFFNMFTLYFFGTEAAYVLGAQRFLYLYLGGGLLGSTFFVLWPTIADKFSRSEYFRRYRYMLRDIPGLGASGAVSSVVMWGICSNPSRIVYIYMIVPVPAALFGLMYIASDAWSLFSTGATTTSATAHLGGAFFGTMYYLSRRFGGRRFR